ncbi:filamentous hemagglutinin N-terminal domain-containing protein [Haemophilus influenzae]|nr:filamentous hemagglutinin N-terminal domain-containing protein [Haemophilus influenzae]
MNKIYRLKFSKRLNALVAVSELTRGCDHSTEKGSEKPVRTKVRHLALKPLSAILLSLGIVSIPQSVLASGLQGMSVVHGTATMQVDGNKTTIRNSVNAIINWKQFNIDQNEMVQFLQESNNSAVFNRVTSDQISQLKGILDSNGQVFLINPNGITIGKDAIINTNGFTASTLDISNENIKAHNFTLEQTKDKALAEIVNHGLITVGKDGSVNLIGGKVKNEGVISVNGGSISLLAGQKITISDIINPTITYSIAAPENEAINLGDIFAKGGNINVRAANIRNQGKLSADSVSKDKSGNIVLSAKEGEAEIGGVISAQNQQAKGGKLMITGDKVTLKTGAVIDLSGKEGGETYLGGDERGEGKNGIQLAKKTSLEKGSTINVSGKEKGGRAIVWGDVALIDGNINAQGKDIAKTGGFVETSGHYLSIGDNAITKTKEWLLDPDNVTIEAESPLRQPGSIDNELPNGKGTPGDPKRNGEHTTLTNKTISKFLESATSVNITAKREITVNSAINIGANSNLTLWSEGKHGGGVKINGDITSEGGNLTIYSGGWVDVYKNITLNTGHLNITTKKGDIAFEDKQGTSNLTITGQGTITAGNHKGFRFENVSLNGKGKGLSFRIQRDLEDNFNIENKFEGTLNISGKINISTIIPKKWGYSKYKGRTHWNVTHLNASKDSQFNLTIDSTGENGAGAPSNPHNLNGISFNKDTIFNVGKSAIVTFNINAPILTNGDNNSNYALFNGNVSVLGGGNVTFKLNASSSNVQSPGVIINSKRLNASGGSSLTFQTEGSTKVGFLIKKDLTLNATGGNITLWQIPGIDGKIGDGVVADKNITFDGGNITFGSQKATTKIKGNVTINENTNVTLLSSNYDQHKSPLNITGNVTNKGNLTATGSVINIAGNLTVESGAKFLANPNYIFNVSGLFNNKGNSSISIAKGGVQFKDINNTGELNITTNSSSAYHTIIKDITNEKGDLNITNNGNNTEIQISGNISQQQGNLTISSDKINITTQITINKGVNGENSASSETNNANLTIKTKELKLAGDLNISGFNKAEITAKDGSDLTIGNSNDGNSGAEAKTVTFNNVKDSKISADGHNVTLNSKVKTSDDDSSTENDSDNNTSLTIAAKNVEVNNNITSNKAVNITASENVTTKAGSTINATNGKASITTKTGDISGTISGNTVSVSATEGLTTQSGSKIEAKAGEANVTSATGTISGTISGQTVSVTATTDSLTVKGGAKINATEGTATLTASSGKLTTEASSSITSASDQVNLSSRDGSIAGSISAANVTLNTTGTLTTVTGSNIKATSGTLVINAKDADLNGEASGNHTVVNATNANGSGSVIATTSSRVNITGDLITINGLNIISRNGINTVVLKGVEIDVKYIQPGIASVYEVIEAKRALEKVKDLSDEEREALAKLGVSAVRFIELNNTITVDTQNEFATRPLSRIVISEGRACFSNSDGATVCVNIADNGR